MKRIHFDTNIKIPEDGWTVLVRDGVPYHTFGTKAYFMKFGENPHNARDLNRIYTKDIKESDILYHFHDIKDIIIYLNAGRCLNKFILKNDEHDAKEKIIKMLKDGKIIGHQSRMPSKYRSILVDGGLSWSSVSNPDHTKNTEIQTPVLAHTWYEFDDEFELFKWILS